MTNAELITELTYYACIEKRKLLSDAADALEAAEKRIAELEAQLPKEGEWLRTDAFPHRVYCSCCYKTYVPNENWQIWQDDADNLGLPRNYCPNCGAKMKGENDGEEKD